jgi:localization factor PodJL
MSQKRTYLDSLNAGRQRRQSTSIERLNRTLEELEGRIERMPRDDPWRPSHAGRAERRPSGRADESRDHRETGSRYRGSAGETNRARDGELTSISQIVGELRTLRQELGQRMDQGIGQEVAALRRQIERNATPGRHQDQTAVLGAELERLSAMIEPLATRGSESSLHMLRAEIDEVKSALGELAREETVRSVGRRWEEFDRRWDALATDLRSAGADGPVGAALEDRLEQIETALRVLPESLSLRTLEDKMRTLSGVVEELARQQERFSPDALESIERRLDELSRAIVSSTSKRHERQFDPEPLERIEARISALAHQIEDVTAGQGFDISGQIEGISRRVDDLAHRVEVPEQTVERLAEQISAISARLETVPEAPGMGQVVRDMEDRFAEISAKLDSRQDDAIAQGEGLLRELEQRIERIARGADRAVGPDAGEGLMEVLDSRFAEIRDRLDRHAEATIGRSVGHIEERLDEISRRLDAGPSASNIDADLIAGLHDQVAGLAERLMEPNRHLPEMEDLGPRLDHIERAIAETRDRLVDAARQAAEDAVRTMGENQDVAYSREIGQELRSLENLTRTSDERNARTFEAIHDTLIKIVDRLGSVEQRQRNGSPTGVERRETIESPSMTLDFDASEEDNERPAPPPAPRRSASEAASEAARAAMVDDDADGGEPPRDQTSRSLLGGITRALKGRMDRRATGEMERKEPTADVDLDRPWTPSLPTSRWNRVPAPPT